MLGDPLTKVQAGQPLKIPAATYNAFIDAAAAHRANTAGGRPVNMGRELKPWSVIIRDGLDITMKGGNVWNWDSDNLRPILDVVEGDVLTLTASSTNYVYLKCTTTPVSVATYFVCWVNSAYSLYTATEEEDNTVDFSDAVTGGGESYVLLSEITTDGTSITAITPKIRETVEHKWPWTQDWQVFSCEES